jgi:hypothetical protein
MANFIAGAIKHPGALHQQMGVPQGQPIPAGRLQKAAHAPGLLGQRARLAETLKGLPHRMLGGPVHAGRPYMTGERGPEIMVPQQSGRILPNPSTPKPPMPALVRAAMLAKMKGLK